MAKLIVPSVPLEQAILPKPVVTFFNCLPDDVDRDNLLPVFKRLGVTHLTFQVAYNPVYANTTDYERWRSEWERLVYPKVEWCQRNGFRFLAMGDDFFRTEKARQWVHGYDWAAQSVRYIATRLRDSGLCDGIEMVDESKSPSVYQPESFVGWWREAGGPPIAWPGGPRSWDRPDLSDYSSRYWPAWAAVDWPLPKQAKAIAATLSGGSRYRHCLSLIWANRAEYYKRVEGGDYSDGDHEVRGGVRPQDIVAQLWLSLAYGTSGFRIYGYDWEAWRRQRLQTATGSTASLQTGARPGVDRWEHGVEPGLLLVKRYLPKMSYVAYSPTTSGPFVFGRRGDTVWGVNTSIRAQPHPRGKGKVPSGGVVFWNTLELIQPKRRAA